MRQPLEKIQHLDNLWDHYTRREEYSPQQLDKYQRFIYPYSSYQDIQMPTVSQSLVEFGYSAEYPNDSPFAVCLTHDVDEIYPPLSHALLSTATCLKTGNMIQLKDHLFWKFKGQEKSPYRKFCSIMDLEEKYNARSTFYFLATESDIRRFRYKIEDIADDLGYIHDNGWEVGLHGGYYAYNDPDEILREKARLEKALGKEVVGYRNHYLRFCIPDTWKNLVRAGIKYDTTLGYPDAVGFRNGMCHPFQPVDLNAEAAFIDILEIPMVMMDVALFRPGGNLTEAWSLARSIIDTVALYNGVLTLNWHSDSFNCPFKHSYLKIYETILKYCSSKEAWITSGDEIWKWFSCIKF